MKALWDYFLCGMWQDHVYNFKNRTDYQNAFSKLKIWPYLENLEIIKLLCFDEKTELLTAFILSRPKGFNYCNRVGSRTFFNETSQILELFSTHMQTVMSEKSYMVLDQIYLSRIEYSNYD